MSELETGIKSISAGEFLNVGREGATVLDLREPEEVLIKGLDGAVNIPFSRIAEGLYRLPKDRTVYVICRTGELSEEVTEILADRGYDAVNVEGGYEAFEAAVKAAGPVFIDAKGLKCPGPIVRVADRMKELRPGQRVKVEATEDAFFSDIKVWCDRTGNRLTEIKLTDGVIRAEIVKGEAPGAAAAGGNDKTFVVFSGDLDKTIAAFIMANGAAAMGRRVTMFFTFWGLNILRKKEKAAVKKPFIEKLFGAMMPRGTGKLGLSRMNMGGMGAKMIRKIMKDKGISSLEELMEQAVGHGVRLVACQMSMDVMGIRREELIDGVELGGAATFLGAGEQSDMSLFI